MLQDDLKVYRVTLSSNDHAEVTFNHAVIDLSKYYLPIYVYEQLQRGYLLYTDKHCYFLKTPINNSNEREH